jgi:adenosyl cobinamide kinase/adenosyl cobinamide phosphate guanylyltransferase
VITLVLGGARSGKSEVAERLASTVASASADVVYVATAVVDVDDDDMAARVDGHRARRPVSWRTIECGAALVDAVRATPEGTMLVDSLGTWLAAAAPAFDVDVNALCDALVARRGDTVVVSDEVGMGVHPSSNAGRRYRDVLGACNRSVADISERVLLVIAGRVLPLETVD